VICDSREEMGTGRKSVSTASHPLSAAADAKDRPPGKSNAKGQAARRSYSSSGVGGAGATTREAATAGINVSVQGLSALGQESVPIRGNF
jgi:hypothetical protein